MSSKPGLTSIAYTYASIAPRDGPAEVVGNNYSPALPSESAIWDIDLDTGVLTAQWINADGSECLDLWEGQYSDDISRCRYTRYRHVRDCNPPPRGFRRVQSFTPLGHACGESTPILKLIPFLTEASLLDPDISVFLGISRTSLSERPSDVLFRSPGRHGHNAYKRSLQNATDWR